MEGVSLEKPGQGSKMINKEECYSRIQDRALEDMGVARNI